MAPSAIADSRIQAAADRLLSLMRSYGRIAVAFSGGVDSALVAKAAVLACGADAVAVTAVSPSLAAGELDAARTLAEEIGIRHVVIETQEFTAPGYQANAGNRCYFCKSELYDQLLAQLPALQVDVICNGANCDDLGDYRPGMEAAREREVVSPLVDAGMTKQDVRDLARAWGLSVWQKPAGPCLSSRIAYGVEVTVERVQRVDRAEQFLKQLLGIDELRVRLEQNDLARIELPLSMISRLTEPTASQAVSAKFRELGFRYVTLDLQGFRSGSLNQALPLVPLTFAHGPTTS